MDGTAPEGLSWYYLDSVQKEFGPFAQATMREWFTQGFFPNGEGLMIRLPHWERHVALKMVWSNVSEAFMGVPRLSPPGPPQQIGDVHDAFDLYSDLSGLGTRRPSEDNSQYLADMSQMGGCRFWGGNQTDGSASAAALGNGLLGYPMQGVGMPASASTLPSSADAGMLGELLDGMPNLSGGIPPMVGPMSGGMPSNMPGNMMAMSGMPGLMPGAQGPHQAAGPSAAWARGPSAVPVMAQGCADGQFASYSGGFQGPGGMIMQPMQPFTSNQHMQFVQVPTAAGGRANARFQGRIKSFNAKQGFGFIENSEAYAIFGRDVFLHKAQIGNFKVGTEVTYSVEMNKFGMPQARELATLDGKPPGPPPASVVKGGNKPRPAAKKKSKEEEVMIGIPAAKRAAAKASPQAPVMDQPGMPFREGAVAGAAPEGVAGPTEMSAR